MDILQISTITALLSAECTQFRAPQTWPHQTCPVSIAPFLGSVSVFSSFRTFMPAIPYLIPEFVLVAAKSSVPHSGFHFPLFFLGFAHSRISVFSVFSAFSGFQGSRSGIPVFPSFPSFPLFPHFPVFRGPNPEFRFFRFFRFFGLRTRNSGVTAPATFGAATFGAHRTIPGNYSILGSSCTKILGITAFLSAECTKFLGIMAILGSSCTKTLGITAFLSAECTKFLVIITLLGASCAKLLGFTGFLSTECQAFVLQVPPCCSCSLSCFCLSVRPSVRPSVCLSVCLFGSGLPEEPMVRAPFRARPFVRRDEHDGGLCPSASSSRPPGTTLRVSVSEWCLHPGAPCCDVVWHYVMVPLVQSVVLVCCRIRKMG